MKKSESDISILRGLGEPRTRITSHGYRKRLRAQQRLRLQRLGLATANYLVFCPITVYLCQSGQLVLPLPYLVTIFLTVVIANGAFLWLIVTGRNLRFSDPSLTRAQILLAPVFLLIMFAFSRTIFAQDLFLFAFLLTLLFGAFRLDLKQITLYGLPGFVGFSVIMVVSRGYFVESLGAAIARIAIYLVLFGWVTFFVAYISSLRARLSERNQELRAAMGKIEDLAIRDELTGTYNRRFISSVLVKEVDRAERAGRPFSICLLDVDHFKRINDMYGHLVGDTILCELVKRIRHSIRSLDELGQYKASNMLSRFGGEEFLLILPVTDVEGARVCAERILSATNECAFDTQAGDVRVTVSAGVAQYRSGDSIESLVGRADQALYRAKHAGRDRVELYEGP